MQKHNVEQRSPEWLALRQKYPLTASNAQAIGNQGKGLETLVYTKLAERHSSGIKEAYTNEHLERGVELEAQARSLYELETGNKVEEVGFITNKKVSEVGGASPDGLVNDDGLIEIKCFDDVKHFKLSLELVIESQYIWQMQMQMLFTGKKWCDFVAYNPNFKRSILIQRVVEDKEMQDAIKKGLVIGHELIKTIEDKIK